MLDLELHNPGQTQFWYFLSNNWIYLRYILDTIQMLFKQKLDDIQLKKWLDSRLYLDSLQIKHFSILFWTNFGQMAGVVSQPFICHSWCGTSEWATIYTNSYWISLIIWSGSLSNHSCLYARAHVHNRNYWLVYLFQWNVWFNLT